MGLRLCEILTAKVPLAAAAARSLSHPPAAVRRSATVNRFKAPGFDDRTRSLVGALISKRDAIITRLGAADQNTALMVDPDRLATAEWHLRGFDVVSALCEILDDSPRHAVLDPQFVAEREDARCLDQR